MTLKRPVRRKQRRGQLNLRKLSHVIRAELVILVVCSCNGCNQGTASPSTRPTSKATLQEPESIRRLTVEELRKRDANARATLARRCDEIISSVSYSGLRGDFQASAMRQAKVVRDALARKEAELFHCICARSGWTGTGRGYLHVEVVNTNRDTAKIVFVRATNQREILFSYDLAISEKKQFLFSIEYIEGEFRTLDEIIEDIKLTGSSVLNIRVDTTVPLASPKDVESSVLLYCESLDGHQTNAVPIQRVDFGQPAQGVP